MIHSGMWVIYRSLAATVNAYRLAQAQKHDPACIKVMTNDRFIHTLIGEYVFEELKEFVSNPFTVSVGVSRIAVLWT